MKPVAPRFAVPLLFALSLGFAPRARASAGIFNAAQLPDLVDKILPSVANISTITRVDTRAFGMQDFFQLWGVPQERKQTSLGSGVLIDANGYLFTNNHVVANADEIVVTLQDKRTFKAKIVGKDAKLDLALLQLQDDKKQIPAGLKPAALANSDQVRIGEPVLAVGNPFGLQGTVTSGIISAKNRTIGIGPLDNFLQTDASINPGNSGGPLFNLKGEVVGINTLIFSRAQQSAGIGFSIPSNEAKNALEELKKFGRIPRPWLGVIGERVTPPLAAYYGLGKKEGVLIFNLVQSSPADSAGLRRGDIVFKVESRAVADLFEVEQELFKRKPGETLTMSVQRGNKQVQIKVKLKELPSRIEELPQGLI